MNVEMELLGVQMWTVRGGAGWGDRPLSFLSKIAQLAVAWLSSENKNSDQELILWPQSVRVPRAPGRTELVLSGMLCQSGSPRSSSQTPVGVFQHLGEEEAGNASAGGNWLVIIILNF